MTITDDTSTEQDEQEQRSAAIAGLRELADFLDSHPGVPLPNLTIHAPYEGRAALAAWLDGYDDLDVRPGIIEQYRSVVRRFCGIDVPLSTKAEYVGETQEVPSTKTELVPFTPEQIRARAVTA